MSVTIKIHRGTKQIGGSITEIYTENTHLFIDFGAELPGTGEESSDRHMAEMIQNAKCDGVLFTHYHGDHVGLMKEIPEKDIQGHPIRMGLGKVSREVLINIHKTLANHPSASAEKRAEHEYMLSLLKDGNRWENLQDGIQFSIGDFQITPMRIDHSAYDAFLFVIEAEGKCIVHTGDFRTHGRLGAKFLEQLKERLKRKRVNVLLTEGTMMSRLSEKVLSEPDMERKIREELGKPENKHVFLICSSTNVESLASFHNAACKLKRPFIVNHYVYEQLLLYRNTAGVEDKRMCFCKSYPFEPMEKYNPKLKGTQPEYMEKNGFVMLVGTGPAYIKRMEYFRKNDPLLIYSMWDGYLKEGDAYNPKLKALYDKWPRHLNLHTSGHACREDIEQMILLTHPDEAIIPIHTEKKERFYQLAIGDLGEKVHPLSDRELYRIVS